MFLFEDVVEMGNDCFEDRSYVVCVVVDLKQINNVEINVILFSQR